MRNPDIRGYENWDFRPSEMDPKLVVVSGNSCNLSVSLHTIHTAKYPFSIKRSGLLLDYSVHMIKTYGKFETELVQ